jgi:hypothetical protein
MNYNPLHTGIHNNLFELTIDFNDLEIDRQKIEATLGYTEHKIPIHFSGLVDEIICELPARCSVKTGFRILDIKNPDGRIDGLSIANTFFNTGKIVAGQIKKAEQVALFVSTIGSEMEKWSKDLFIKGDPLMCYLVDTIASVTVENVTAYLHDYIEELMLKKGLKITNRYSPGYCSWPVSDQHLLFSLLPSNFCGITLTESALMTPIKSVSGIIGIGHQVKRKDYICDKCGVDDCTYKSKKTSRSRLIKA